jgi:anthranilate synthase/aminodeoxychorismate synthase-like glutamine amidotransferase
MNTQHLKRLLIYCYCLFFYRGLTFRLLSGRIQSALRSILDPQRVYDVQSGSSVQSRDLTVVRTLLIDNYDSYTYNIWQYLSEMNFQSPQVIYNNDYHFLRRLQDSNYSLFDNIVISPGPGTVTNPKDFGICLKVLQESPIPVLGICLGHQGLSFAYGGRIEKAPQPIHGRLWSIQHSGSGLFENVKQNTLVVRYHSLIVSGNYNSKFVPDLPPSLQVTAWTKEGIIMGLQHCHKPLYGWCFLHLFHLSLFHLFCSPIRRTSISS